MRLRQQKADFIIEEQCGIPILTKAPSKNVATTYFVYKLQKSLIDTIAALKILAKERQLQLKKIGYAGLKDKFGITSQYITYHEKFEDYIRKAGQDKQLSCIFQGYSDRPIQRAMHSGNRFTITVRDLTAQQIQLAKERQLALEKNGFINYYDTQRFGAKTGASLVAEYLVEEQYEDALKLYIAKRAKPYNKTLRAARKFLLEHWGQWSLILKKYNHVFDSEDKKILQVLQAPHQAPHPSTEQTKINPFLAAFKAIPQQRREMIFISYQSYLWNQYVSKQLQSQQHKDDLLILDTYGYGEFTFIKNKNVALVSERIPMPHPAKRGQFHKNYKELVVHYDQKIQMLDSVAKACAVSLNSGERDILCYPKNTALQVIADDMNKGQSALICTFTLNAGAYATMYVKQLLLAWK